MSFAVYVEGRYVASRPHLDYARATAVAEARKVGLGIGSGGAWQRGGGGTVEIVGADGRSVCSIHHARQDRPTVTSPRRLRAREARAAMRVARPVVTDGGE